MCVRVLKSTILIMVLYFAFLFALYADDDKLERGNLELYTLITSNADSALLVLPELYVKAKEDNDILKQAYYLIYLGDIYLDKLNYPEALNYFTEGLFLAEQIESTNLRAKALNRLGKIYIRFGKIENGERYLRQSLEVAKQSLDEGKIRYQHLKSYYLDLCIYEKSRENYSIALQFLDSCFYISDSIGQQYSARGFILAERADLLIKSNEIEQALEILYPLEQYYTDTISKTGEYNLHTSNLTFVEYYLGLALNALDRRGEALVYYDKALESIKNHNKNLPLQPIIFKQISEIHERYNDYKLAHYYLGRSKALNESYYYTNSKRNIDALSLKDSYREALDKKEKQLTAEKLKLLKKEKTILYFRSVSILVVLVVAIGILLIWNRFQKEKNENEKILIGQQLKEKERHAQAVIELKNKELTRYALELMERDELLDRFAMFVKKSPHTEESRSLISNRQQMKVEGWDEFDKRFVSINEGFYERLADKYPALTLTDQKHCALLKLQLSGKEAAKIMGISDKSIHMAHYRIRKKLKIRGDINLMEYIGKI